MKTQLGSTVDTVRDFWQAYINNECYTDAQAPPEKLTS
jgi:hypothetical protein